MHPNTKRVLAEFDGGEKLTAYDLELRCYIDVSNVRKHIAKIRVLRPQRIRIVGWRREITQGPWVAIYQRGTGPDVEKPAPLTNAERHRKYATKPEVLRYFAEKARVRRARPKLANYEYSLSFLALGKLRGQG